MDIIAQNMRFRQTLMNYIEKNGMVKASLKYNTSHGRTYIFCLNTGTAVCSFLTKRPGNRTTARAARLSVKHKLIRPYTPRCNGKVGILTAMTTTNSTLATFPTLAPT